MQVGRFDRTSLRREVKGNEGPRIATGILQGIQYASVNIGGGEVGEIRVSPSNHTVTGSIAAHGESI
jgi:hypothetical protein